MDYWKECIREAFEEAEITATQEQIDTVISWVEGAHENYGMATGRDCIPNPLKLENDELKKTLKLETSKRVCKDCGGCGRIISLGPYHSSNSQCFKCFGEGKVNP